MKRRRLALAAVSTVLAVVVIVTALTAARQAAPTSLTPASLKEWLTYIASDDLEGRETFTEGLALAGAYIAERLREAGVKPGGDHGLYFQRVSVLDVNSMNRSTVTVDVRGQTKTFRNGQGVTFHADVGGKRTFTLDDIRFVGYGMDAGAAHNDYRGLDMRGKASVWLGAAGPAAVDQRQDRSPRDRESFAIENMGSAASISFAASPPPRISDATAAAGIAGRFTTAQRLDSPRPPGITADETFFEFLFSGAAIQFAELKSRGERRQDLLTFRLDGVKITFNIDSDYRIVRTQYTRNVVGIVEGTDPKLKDTYVAVGAHYDHLGYAQNASGVGDRIYNGADDDGTGIAAAIGLARAFAAGPKPKRSLLFVWHSGEEKGLYGSRYFADNPAVPIDQIVAQLNIDMIGRNRNNDVAEGNVVYAVGSDRISTELHNILIDANAAAANPLKIDFEMNDPRDPERFYYRSDHYSYASKGIPVIFFFTGTHPDYHQLSDSVDKIDFEKMSRITQLVYEVARRVANLDHAPARDFKGARAGRGTKGKL